MRVVLDIEANGLVNPTQIWCIVCKDIDTGKIYRFKDNYEEFIKFSKGVTCWIGHHILGYDIPVLSKLLGTVIECSQCIDTLIVSKLVNYSRSYGHSLESYGIEFEFVKGKNSYPDFFSKWSQALEDYCVRDVEISHKVYLKYLSIIGDPDWAPSIALEQAFQLVVNSLSVNGFSFNTPHARSLLERVSGQLETIDKELLDAFPPRLHPINAISPRLTKYGTLNRSDFRWHKGEDLSEFNGGSFTRCIWKTFNASSHKQIIEVLRNSGWSPTEKTKTHIEVEREYNRAKFTRNGLKQVDVETQYAKLLALKKSGWKINELNLASLPDWTQCRLKIENEETHTLVSMIKNLSEEKRGTLGVKNIIEQIQNLEKSLKDEH